MKGDFVSSYKTKYLVAILFCLISSLSAQMTESSLNIFEKMAMRDLTIYKKMIANEQSITPNQEMYDVKYYSINLIPNPTTEMLKGTIEIVAEVLSLSLDSMEFNFWEGMTITDLYLSSLPDHRLSYFNNDDILSIDLDSTFQQAELIALTVIYEGYPQNSGYNSFAFDTYNGDPMIWTLSAPYGARAWWPCKDVPSDKADSLDIRVTVPNDLIVASNGTLRETNTLGDTTTYWWHEQYPISTYLVSLAIHPYTVSYDNYFYNDTTDTMEIHFYMFPNHHDHYAALNAKTKDMISCFVNLFGEYPFVEEKYGHAEVVPSHFGAVEHQTCTSFDFTYFITPFWIEWMINHELAHQWWGNLVTCKDFHHIWLNEGFATYSSAFWYEYLEGPGAASEYMMDNGYYLGPGTVYVENPNDFEIIFDTNLTYLKAAFVVHMLRHVVTDTVFFKILKTYASSPQHQYGSATTEDFQAICEQLSGMNLQKFFQQWIYEEYYPFYEYHWTVSPDSIGFKVNLVIDQVQQRRVAQNAPIFWMPIDIKMTTDSYDTTFVIWDSLESQSFEFYLEQEPHTIELDPGNWILKQSEEITGIVVSTESIPEKFTLFQNFPNPFNSTTMINYQLPVTSNVKISIYNLIGQKVATLVNERKIVGYHRVEWDASGFASGIYYYRIVAGDFQDVKNMILIK